jgi:hypothetical protein
MLERKLRKISNLKNTFWREVSLGLNLSQLPQNLEIESDVDFRVIYKNNLYV